MKTITDASLVVGFVSAILGIISRLIQTPIFVHAKAFLLFAMFSFLVAIAFSVYKIAYKDGAEE